MSALLRNQLDGSIALLHRELLYELREAFLEAIDEQMTDEALSAALRRHRLVLSREPPKPKAKPYFIEVR